MSLLRYVAADALRAERWTAPVLLFLAFTATFHAGGGTPFSLYGFTATLLLPVTLWLAVAVINSEDPLQEAVTVVTAGGWLRVRLAKLGVAYLIGAALTVVALAWPVAAGRPVSGTVLAAGAVAHLLTGLAGVSFGAVLARPVLDRLAWVVVLAVTACVLEVLVPHCPPVHALLSLFATDPPDARDLTIGLTLITTETLLLTTALIALSATRRD